MNFIKQIFDYLKDSQAIKSLLHEYKGEHLHSLYWHDIPLEFAISWRGFVKVFLQRVMHYEYDAVASNYGVKTLYFKDVGAKDPCKSGASVWHCQSIDNEPCPLIDKRNIGGALKENTEDIISEFHQFKDHMQLHPDSDSLAETGRWDGLFLYGIEGKEKKELKQWFCRTFEILEKFPLCTSFGFVAFSSIEAKIHIASHVGSSNLRLRYHLGVSIPEEGAAKIRVADEWKAWVQGSVLMFDDSFDHEVIHDGEKPRVVLIVDIWHPSLTDEDIQILSNPVFSRLGR